MSYNRVSKVSEEFIRDRLVWILSNVTGDELREVVNKMDINEVIRLINDDFYTYELDND